MVINKKYLNTKDLNVYDWFLMHLVFLNSSEDMSEELIQYLPNEILNIYEEKKYITKVKAKKKTDHEYKAPRLSKTGKEIYRNSQILDFTIQDEKLYEYLVTLFEGIDKPVGNPARIKQLLAWFRVETTYSRKLIYKSISTYIQFMIDKGKEQYISSLENLIWKSNNVFSTKWSLADSKLYQFIQEHKKELHADTTN
jgi:hypothetical protein